MDARIRSFDDEVATQFGPLAVFGLTSFRLEEVGAPTHVPYSRTITLLSAQAIVTCALVFEPGGGATVQTSVRTTDGDAAELSSNAYKGSGMRKSIAAHARQVEALLAEWFPGAAQSRSV